MITKKVYPNASSVTLTGTVAAPLAVLKANLDESLTKYTEANITIDEVFTEDSTQSASKTIENAIPNAYVKEITVEVVPVQTGSGDPSPSNIRPITGFTKVNVDVSGNNYEFTLASECYGGEVVLKSSGTGTQKTHTFIHDLGDYTWTKDTTYNRFVSENISQARISDLSNYPAWCTCYKLLDRDGTEHQQDGFTIGTSGTKRYIYIYDSTKTSMTADDFKTAVTGQKICFQNISAQLQSLSGLQTIDLIEGTNVITCDTGDIKSIKYLSGGGISTIPFPASVGNIYSGTIEVYENGTARITANGQVYTITAPVIMLNDGTTDISIDTGDITMVGYHFPVSNRCHIRATFPIGNNVFIDEDFSMDSGVRLSTYMNPDTNMRFGTAFSKEVQFDLLKSSKTEHFDWNQEFKLEFGTEVNGVTDWTAVGYFMNNTPVDYRNSDVISITANDRMRMFDRTADDFARYVLETVLTKAGASTYKFSDFYNDLLLYIGLDKEDGDELPVVMTRNFYDYRELFFRNVKQKETTLREILCWFAEINGCYARITNEGKVQLVWFSDCTGTNTVPIDDTFSSTVTDIYQVESFLYEWQDVENITWDDVGYYNWGFLDKTIESYKIVATQSYDSAYHTINIYPQNYGTKDNLYTIVDNPFFISPCKEIPALDYVYVYNKEQAILHAINDRISQFESNYTADVVAVGNYLAEAGDIISVEISAGEIVQMPVYNLVFVWNGSCECEYITTGSADRDEDLEIAERLSRQTATMRDLQDVQSQLNQNAEDIESAKEDIKTNTNDIENLTSSVGTLSNSVSTLTSDVQTLNTAVGNIFKAAVMSSGNLNNHTKGCVYTGTSVTNQPSSHNYYVIAYEYSSNAAMQIAIRAAGTTAWFRTKQSGSWNAWKQFSLVS